MTPTQPIPKDFTDNVKQVLEHLYDFSYLQTHPLAEQLAITKQRPSETNGHHLRREVIKSIESLSPGAELPMQTPDARLYSLLQLHYVEGLTVKEVGMRLGLSTRQTHRSLRRAEESVTALLWSALVAAEKREAASPAPPQPSADDDPETTSSAQQLSSVQEEMARLALTMQPVALAPLIVEALRSVRPLAAARGMALVESLPDESVMVSADTAVAGQIVVSLLSRVVQQAGGTEVGVSLTAVDPIDLTLTFALEHTDALERPADPTADIVSPLVAQLAERLDWRIRQRTLPPTGTSGERRQVVLNMTRPGALIMVVDDNAGLVELLERYLTGHHCRVVTATSGREALDLLAQVTPSALILDVMMPGVSGWEVLQTVRSRPDTAVVPVVVCSLFNDPDLAYALGASRFIAKPVGREQVLAVLRELDVV
ncbi:MAG: response regulator [Anaerolineales bacterium]|nr:response regulator [Anaerolineales bacterium]